MYQIEDCSGSLNWLMLTLREGGGVREREILIEMEGHIPVTDLETLLSELGCKSQCLCFSGILGFLNVIRFVLASVLRTMCRVYMSCSHF